MTRLPLDCLRRLYALLRRDGYRDLQYVPFAAHDPQYVAKYLDVVVDDERRLLAARADVEPILYTYSLCPEHYAQSLTKRQRLIGDLFLHNRPVDAAIVRDMLPDYYEYALALCSGRETLLSPIRLVPIFEMICIADPLVAQGNDYVFFHNDSVQMARYLMRSNCLVGKTVADIGTGSGVLALAARHAGASHVLATDINPRCLEYSRATFQLNDRPEIEVRAGSIGAVVKEAQTIVANPPYMRERAALALSGGGEHGLATAIEYVRTAREHGKEMVIILDLPTGEARDVFLHDVGVAPTLQRVIRRRPGFELVVFEFGTQSKGQ